MSRRRQKKLPPGPFAQVPRHPAQPSAAAQQQHRREAKRLEKIAPIHLGALSDVVHHYHAAGDLPTNVAGPLIEILNAAAVLSGWELRRQQDMIHMTRADLVEAVHNADALGLTWEDAFKYVALYTQGTPAGGTAASMKRSYLLYRKMMRSQPARFYIWQHGFSMWLTRIGLGPRHPSEDTSAAHTFAETARGRARPRRRPKLDPPRDLG